MAEVHRACIDDLIAVLALPAVRDRGDDVAIASRLLDVVINSLAIEFVYLQLGAVSGDAPLEIVRTARPDDASAEPRIRRAAGSLPAAGAATVVLPNPLGDGDMVVTSLRLGPAEGLGMLVVGSRRPDFPRPTEMLFIQVAANQAVIGLQEARLLGERQRSAEELDRIATERAAELNGVNAELRMLVGQVEKMNEMVQHTGAGVRDREVLPDADDACVPARIVSRERRTGRSENGDRGFGEIVGQSAAMAKVFQQIEMVAPTDAAVLISGESGTGKELVARAIHHRSERQSRAMVTANCAAVPRELFESEFFGHVKGAFTGAVRDRSGRFQLADRGTIFLDEVGDIPLELQSKLLRALQEGQVERIGDDQLRQVDVRVVSATNHDLERDIEAGRFRRDLFYRLCVFPIHLAPLRERRDDIAPLVAHFLERAAARLNRPGIKLTAQALALCEKYHWPGNVRELRNVIERAVILSHGSLRVDLALGAVGGSSPISTSRIQHDAPLMPVQSQDELKQRERENLLTALRQTGWRIYGSRGTAAILGLKPTTLASRLKRLGIERRHR